ncbi:mRNA splicing protein [Coemansia erecta]|uniref:Pre-mRNA-splicing factor SLU7 n=1 Tax=Coemansia erecta TaxID=147472 RepID=A0A9W7Y7A5_9FUNG|nr:mRNA splicing protein [Coemansia erecta]
MSSSAAGKYKSGKLSREDYKKQKDLEEARKAGTAPAELDSDGNAINPHIPQFMSKAPWYMDTGKAGLHHQRKRAPSPTTSSSSSAAWYARGQTSSAPAPKKYKRGACENCGAMSHKTKQCVERPRKRGARWTGEDMRANEEITDVRLAYEAKRDRWNGYDAERHRGIMREWEGVEEARRRRKALELDTKKAGAGETGDKTKAEKGIEDELGSSDEESAEDAEDAEARRPRAAVRNLRIREDTAKYLRNLDPDSAYYDPKTRSMRENPYATTSATSGSEGSSNPVAPSNATAYAGDNFVRYSGESREVAKKEVFAWEAEARGNLRAHFQANPTQAALMYEEFREKKEERRGANRAKVLETYGGEEHLKAPARELRMLQEAYVEYSRDGRVVRAPGGSAAAAAATAATDAAEKAEGAEGAAAVRSRYREDVHPMNHAAVYGSWWCDGQWGYACCRQLPRNAYCTASASAGRLK